MIDLEEAMVVIEAEAKAEVCTPEESLEVRLRTALRAALAAGNDRQCRAGTSIAVSVDDSGATLLLLDRPTPVISGGVGDGEVSIHLTAEQTDAFARGQLCLPLLVASGEARCSGPVGKFLAVRPGLRSLSSQDPPRRRHGPTSLMPTEPDARTASCSPIPPTRCGPVDQTVRGHALASFADHSAHSSFAVEIHSLHKRYDARRILAGLNLMIPAGTLSVVIGPPGSGKSVLLQHIVGLVRPDDGEVLIHGRALSKMTRTELVALRQDVGVMYQDGALFRSMTVFDNVAFPLRQYSDVPEREVRALVMEHLRGVDLDCDADKLPSQLSAEMEKRAILARALVLDPLITLCDEPSAGLDPVSTALLGDVLIDRHARLGGTMIVVTRDATLARHVADHVSVIWRGEVVEAGPAGQVWNSGHPFVSAFLNGRVPGTRG